MATTDIDPLLFLRQAIATGTPVVPTASDAADAPETPLPEAQFLQFGSSGGGDRTALRVDAATRFLSGDAPVDLRSIYFAWINREVAIPEYNAAATRLNEALAAAAGASVTVHKFAFVERLDLITWLEGASEESEYIQALGGAGAGGAGGVGSAGGATGGVGAGQSVGGVGTGGGSGGGAGQSAGGSAAIPASRAGRGALLLDPRLAVIYGGERRMGDHNTALRGIKATDFSFARKAAVPFMSKKQQQAAAVSAATDRAFVSGSLSLNPKVPQPHAGSGSIGGRRPDPIILLSPSASSLLRMSNIKSFLETGRYVPADNSSTATMLHVMRTMKDIDATRPLRFILVEGPEHFKPEHWSRVVAVFTTGQAWQFKSYKWSNPAELFRHVLGVYVGWRTEALPPGVRDWGHRVLTATIDKWTDPAVPGAETNRWRDREVAETIWKAIESNMRQRGWKRDAGAALN